MRRRAAGALTATLLLVAGAAGAAPFEIGPYLQDARPDGALVVWEGSPSAGEVIVAVGAVERRFAASAGAHHAVRVSGLPPGSWPYRVVAQGQTRTGTLRTAVVGDQPFTFLVYGDSRNERVQHARLVAAMAAQEADLLLGTGDLVEEGGSDNDWVRLFDVEQPLLASHPLYAAPGNHEYAGDPTLAHFRRYFAPQRAAAVEGEAPVDETTSPVSYAFRYGNSLFIALDASRAADRRQSEWLAEQVEEAQEDATVRHVFLFDHQPAFAVGDLCGSAVDQGTWMRSFAAPKVRAIFSGHVHAYEHLERARVRYFVTGGAGAPLDGRGERCEGYDEAALLVYRAQPHYLRVRVAGAFASLDAIGAEGELLDHVRLDEEPADRPIGPVPFADSLPHPRQVDPRGISTRLTNGLLALFVALLVAAGVISRRRGTRRAS